MQKQNIHKIRYDNFIASRKLRKISKDTYTENHHIIPKSIDGSDEPSNMILLTGREHYISHLILWKAYGKEMTYAFWMMSNNKNKYKSLTSKQYEELKKQHSKNISKAMTGVGGINYGRKCSDETKKKLREFNQGKKLSEETKRKISFANKGKTFSLASREKVSIANKGKRKDKTYEEIFGKEKAEKIKQTQSKSHIGKIVTQVTKDKLRITSTGKFYSKETREKMSNSAKLRKASIETRKKISEAGLRRKRESCKICGRFITIGNMNSHYNSCKKLLIQYGI